MISKVWAASKPPKNAAECGESIFGLIKAVSLRDDRRNLVQDKASEYRNVVISVKRRAIGRAVVNERSCG